MNIIDRYILRKFYTTLFFIVIMLSAIFVVIDITQKSARFAQNDFTILDAIIDYYPFYLLWAINTFFSIVVFISVLLFTSRMANNSEIVAIISSGVSFFRFSLPYFVGAFLIMCVSLLVNHLYLPASNIYKNEFDVEIMSGRNKAEYYSKQKIASQVGPNDFLFVASYSRLTKNGSSISYQKFDSLNRLTYELNAGNLIWNPNDSAYTLTSYYERFVKENQPDSLVQGSRLEQKFDFTPDELLPEAYVAETMNSMELQKFIEKEKVKGSGNINSYKFELFQRTSMPVAIVILTVLALSLSSEKRRGGIGINLAVGLILAFAFIFFFQVLASMSSKSGLDPLLAAWLPDIVFGILAIYLYFRRALA